MLNPAFLHPSPTTAPLNRASDVVLPAERDHVLPSGHAPTLDAGPDERQRKMPPLDVREWTPRGGYSCYFQR